MVSGMKFAECVSERKAKKHYHANKELYFDKKKSYVRETQRQMREYKTAKGCVDCRETDHDFDHIDPKTKVGNVATLARKWSYEKLLSEIEKCEVRCLNCQLLKLS